MQNQSSPGKPCENSCAEMMLQLSTVKKACSSIISSKSGTLSCAMKMLTVLLATKRFGDHFCVSEP